MEDRHVTNLIVVCGTTASGKTRLGVAIARHVRGEIISVDSRQVYRGLDVGAGKDLAEYQTPEGPLRHHLIDIADPRQIYTLWHYQRDFYRVFDEIRDRGVMPVAVGGSGLYLEAVLRRYPIPDVPEDAGLRAKLMALDKDVLDKRLLDLDPGIHAATDRSSKKRIVRAIEVALSRQPAPSPSSTPPSTTDHAEPVEAGAPDLCPGNSNALTPESAPLSPSSMTDRAEPVEAGAPDTTQSHARPPRPSVPTPRKHRSPAPDTSPTAPHIAPLVIGVRWPRPVLHERIRVRLLARMDGLIDETGRLLADGVTPERLALLGLEYRHAARHVLGQVTREQMFEDLFTAIRRFAKRQETYFRGMERRGVAMRWIEGDDVGAAMRLVDGVLAH